MFCVRISQITAVWCGVVWCGADEPRNNVKNSKQDTPSPTSVVANQGETGRTLSMREKADRHVSRLCVNHK
jgi:hypothetical protein